MGLLEEMMYIKIDRRNSVWHIIGTQFIVKIMSHGPNDMGSFLKFVNQGVTIAIA